MDGTPENPPEPTPEPEGNTEVPGDVSGNERSALDTINERLDRIESNAAEGFSWLRTQLTATPQPATAVPSESPSETSEETPPEQIELAVEQQTVKRRTSRSQLDLGKLLGFR